MEVYLDANGPIIRLVGDTEIKIVRLAAQDNGVGWIVDTMIELRKGRIIGNVRKTAAASSYLIRTHGGVIQIPGATFKTDADGSLSLIDGTGIVHFGGKTYQVQQGEQFKPGTGISKKGELNPLVDKSI